MVYLALDNGLSRIRIAYFFQVLWQRNFYHSSIIMCIMLSFEKTFNMNSFSLTFSAMFLKLDYKLINDEPFAFIRPAYILQDFKVPLPVPEVGQILVTPREEIEQRIGCNITRQCVKLSPDCIDGTINCLKPTIVMGTQTIDGVASLIATTSYDWVSVSYKLPKASAVFPEMANNTPEELPNIFLPDLGHPDLEIPLLDLGIDIQDLEMFPAENGPG